ncbi:MAG: hypothetical protein JW869_06765 [Candidatus Omnitrophica bacterium]|nr:hypothetical protein [Candidatus Omnitrophota bacterium]
MDDIYDSLNEDFHSVDSGHIYDDTISSIERAIISKALKRTEGNQIQAARLLGLNRNTLHKKIQKLDIDVERFKK